MILLPKNDYHKAIGALDQVEINHLFAKTVIEQKMDGSVYVDQLEKPTSFYVKHAYGMSLLFGETANKPFNLQLVEYLLNKEKRRVSSEWLQVFPNQWNTVLTELLNNKLVGINQSNENPNSTIVVNTRVNFRFNKERFNPIKTKKFKEMKLVELDKNLFDQMPGTVVPKYFWRNAEEFEKNGIGFCLLQNNKPVSTVFSAFVHRPKIELGIETLAGHYGKGLAKITCSALIEHCLKNDFEPIWACRKNNIGSFKLAEKLGFEVERMIPYYQLPTN